MRHPGNYSPALASAEKALIQVAGFPDLVISVYNDTLIDLSFVLEHTIPPPAHAVSGLLAETATQLKEYFAGERKQFSLPLNLEGTDFQRLVWAELERIPYGTTISYGALAARVGNPKGARAVGLANNRNPIGIIIPCHRVIGANGALTGYAGGLDAKAALLELERRHAVQATL